MAQNCHLNGNNFLLVRKLFLVVPHPPFSTFFFSRFRTSNSAPKLRFRTGARCGGSEDGEEVPTSAGLALPRCKYLKHRKA